MRNTLDSDRWCSFAGGINLYKSPIGIQMSYTYYDSIALGRGLCRYNDPRPINRREISINRGEDERGLSAILDLSLDRYYIEAHFSNIRDSYRRKLIENHYTKIEIPLKDYTKIVIDYEYLLKRYFEPEVDLKIENISKIIYEGRVRKIGLYTSGSISFIKADELNYTEGSIEISLSYDRFSVIGSYTRRSKKIIYLEEDVRWRKLELMMEAPDNLFLKFMLGEEMGGFICSGGVCRWESPFRGAKFLLEKSF